jgi:hypothetical protein
MSPYIVSGLAALGLLMIGIGSLPKRRWPKDPEDLIKRRGQFRDG